MSDSGTNPETIKEPSIKSRLRVIDFFVLVFFLLTALLGLYLFQQDLMRTIDSRNEEPAGVIVMRNNVVQRRHDDRVLWDRIFVNSYVYSGDLIRAADLSSAQIDIAQANVFLNENTLIRIQRSSDGRGPMQVELREGNLSIASYSQAETNLLLNLLGRIVQADSGTVLSASATEEGISLQVNEGTARFINEGQSREITEGTMISLDEKGTERILPSAVVTRPSPNARYLKTEPQDFPVTFLWNRLNMESDERLDLVTASDPGFTRDVKQNTGLGSFASVSFKAGIWYWKLVLGNSILSSGRFTIADGSFPSLISPVNGSLIRYSGNNLPLLRLQWSPNRDADYYIIEIDQSSSFTNPIRRQSASSSLIMQELGSGIWHWRVKPVFVLYDGEALWSPDSSFTIERINTSASIASVNNNTNNNTSVSSASVDNTSTSSASGSSTSTNNAPTVSASVSGTSTNNTPAVSASASSTSTNNAPTVSASNNNTSLNNESLNTNPANNDSANSSPVNIASRVLEFIIPEPVIAAIPDPLRLRTGVRRLYTVVSGDTLSKIARQEYGNGMLWTRIVEANNIQNPDLIYPGQEFIIP